MHPMLNTAVKAARRAGSIINRASLNLDKVIVSTKSPGNYVTDIDKAAEEAIIEVLQTAYPDHAFFGEETGAIGQSEYRWIIDPLDGTKNFIRGLPNYAISIALTHRGVITHAVVYDPNANEIFTASRGDGAFMNDRRIRVSNRSLLEESVIAVAGKLPSEKNDNPNTLGFYQLVNQASGYRRLGSTVLELAYVACGRLDGYCGRRINAWDSVAGSLLIIEAGGLLSDIEGEQAWTKTGNIVAGTPKVFSQMLSILQD